MARLISFVILVTALLGVVALFVWVMAGFILPLFVAALLVVIFRPLHMWILLKCHGMRMTSAALTTAAILLIVLAPLGLFVSQATVEAVSLARQASRGLLTQRFADLRKQIHLDIPPDWSEQFALVEITLADLADFAAEPPKTKDELMEEDERLQTLEAAAANMRALVGDAAPRSTGTAEPERQANTGHGTPVPPNASAAAPDAGLAAGATSEIHGDGQRDDDADDLLPSNVRAVREFAQSVGKLRALVDEAIHEDLRGADFKVRRFRALLAEVRLALQTLRQEVLGGPLLAWLKTWANPTEDQVAQWTLNFIDQAQSVLAPLALGTTQALISFVIGLVILIVSLYFFLADGPGMIRACMRMSPLGEHYVRQLLEEFDRVSRAVVLATVLSAIAQGILGGIGYYIAGLESVFLLTMLTMVLATIPFVGAGAVWFPCSIWLILMEGRLWAGFGLMAYGFFVVSLIDNFIKPLVLHGQSSLHPLLALLSILGGVQALGPIGVLVGPMVVVFLQALLNMLNTELASMDSQPMESPPPPPPPSLAKRFLRRNRRKSSTRGGADEPHVPSAKGETAESAARREQGTPTTPSRS